VYTERGWGCPHAPAQAYCCASQSALPSDLGRGWSIPRKILRVNGDVHATIAIAYLNAVD